MTNYPSLNLSPSLPDPVTQRTAPSDPLSQAYCTRLGDDSAFTTPQYHNFFYSHVKRGSVA